MNSEPISETKRLWAFGLGVITLLCTLSWFLSFLIVSAELKRVGDDAPPFYPGIIFVLALVVTLPVALICTAVSMFLVGLRRSKLAWISLCVYLLPILIGIAIHFMGLR